MALSKCHTAEVIAFHVEFAWKLHMKNCGGIDTTKQMEGIKSSLMLLISKCV